MVPKCCPKETKGDVENLKKGRALSDAGEHVTDKYMHIVFTLVLDLHVTYKLAHIYDHVTKLCKQKADVVQNHENINVPNTE
jgi:hypothetical protein